MAKIELHGFWRSIATYRVRVALKLKGLDFEEHPVDLLAGHQFLPDFGRINPAHALPALTEDGAVLTQSLAILEYLDETHPEPPLLPEAPRDRAQARAFALVTIADAHPLITPRVRKALTEEFGADEAKVHAWAARWVTAGLNTFERLLERRAAAPFAFGVTPSIADIAFAGHVAMAEFFKVGLPAFPRSEALAKACFALPAFAEAHPMRVKAA